MKARPCSSVFSFSEFRLAEVFGRFVGNDFYLERYWKEEYLSALAAVERACVANAEETLAAAALRWMLQDSALDGRYGDKVTRWASARNVRFSFGWFLLRQN